jgi:hypothetical protein
MKIRISPRLEFISDAIGGINLTDYEDFDYVIREILLDHPYLIFRGQSNSTWPLRTSLDRLFLSSKNKLPKRKDATNLLNKFRYSTRGRLPSGWTPTNDNSWWALGQHFGLATPLLDWTESPFVAAYFAFLKQTEVINDEYPNRVIWALDTVEVQKISKQLNPKDRVEIINPLSDQNSRLVNQRGLFTKLPIGTDMESWVKNHFKDVDSRVVLIKIQIPEKTGHRNKFLQFLNRANINSLTLFPDLMGASIHCNNSVLIDNYE